MMPKDKKNSIVLFENLPVRRVWVEKENKWYFSVVDVVKILTESVNPTDYIKKMRVRDQFLNKGWGQIVTPLWLPTAGGRQKVNCSNVEGIFRIIQSIPSKKAEPFKQWLAKVGYERLQETSDPEISLNRARRNWIAMGRPKNWIDRRMMGIETRNKLTDYWQENEVKEGAEFAKLTDVIHKEWSEVTSREHKKLKGLKDHNLRDHMTEAELIFTALAEMSTRQISEAESAKGYSENAVTAVKGGRISRDARVKLEQKTGKKVVSKKNFLSQDDKRKLSG